MSTYGKITTLSLVLLVAACAETSASKIEAAKEIMRRQVASDISISIDESSVHLYEPGGGYYYVCGTSTLNRPGTGPLALNNEQQRFITTVNSSGRGGATLFDGSSSAEGKAEFRAAWSAKCK